jgi:hypothetical protein
MRYIAQKHLQRFADLAPIRAANAEIRAAADDCRAAVLDAREAPCSALRSQLWQLSSAKCWYSEASLLEGEGQVEHYRPKRRLWGAEHPGYWWRAFDWRNLRLAHPIANKRMTDYVTRRKAGKGSYFPIQDESQRAATEAEEAREKPVLLDPVRASDMPLLAFSLDTGAPTPAYAKQRNAWFHRRAEESIEYYHLDEATWNMKRHDLMQEVSRICDRLEETAEQVPRDDAAYMKLIDELVEFLHPFAEFSSACRVVVQERGLLQHIAAGVV